MEHLTREQVVRLLTEARAGAPGKGDKNTGERDWVLFLVSFWHGLRASEAVSLTPGNITDGFLDVQRLKGSMRTVQPLVEDPLEILNERAAVEAWLGKHAAIYRHNPHERLFPVSRVQFFRLMRRYGRAAGIPQHLCHPHVLKHSIAMQSIQRAGIENVRQYLGHKSISSTGAYLRVTDEAASRAISSATRSRTEETK
jgi:integrase/recombinase XerD